MAILFTQADGSDQHYDTYEEFEQAMILMKRLNGEEVPQDLLDEAKTKHGVKESKTFQVQINGNNFESAISEEVKKATRELAEELDEVEKDRTPVSGEENDLLPVGTQVKLLSQSFCGDLQPGDVGTITDTDTGCSMGLVYSVRVRSGRDGYGWVGIDGVEVVEEDSSTEFRTGDVVKVTETFEDVLGDRVTCGAVYNYDENIGFGEPSVGTVFLGDNYDKIELVCRAQDRLDKY